MEISPEEKVRREAQSAEHRHRFPPEDKMIRRSMRRQQLHWMSLLGRSCTDRDHGLTHRITQAQKVIDQIDARRAS